MPIAVAVAMGRLDGHPQQRRVEAELRGSCRVGGPCEVKGDISCESVE